MQVSKIGLSVIVSITCFQFLIQNGLSSSSPIGSRRRNKKEDVNNNSKRRLYSNVYENHNFAQSIEQLQRRGEPFFNENNGNTHGLNNNNHEGEHSSRETPTTRVIKKLKMVKKKKNTTVSLAPAPSTNTTKTPNKQKSMKLATKAPKKKKKKMFKRLFVVGANARAGTNNNNSTQDNDNMKTKKKVMKISKIKKIKKKVNKSNRYYNSNSTLTKSPKHLKKKKKKKKKGYSKGQGLYVTSGPSSDLVTSSAPTSINNNSGETDLSTNDNVIGDFLKVASQTASKGESGESEQDGLELESSFDASSGRESNSTESILEDSVINPAKIYESVQPGTFSALNEVYNLLGDDASKFICDETLRTLRLEELVYIIKTFFSEIRYVINEIESNGESGEDDRLEGSYLDGVFGISAEEIIAIESRLVNQLRYDVQIRTICAACNDENKVEISNHTDYSRYCGESAYEHNSIMSGIAYFPVQPIDKTRKARMIVRGKVFDTLLQFRDFNYAFADSSSQLLSWYFPHIFVQLIAASTGSISLSFHQTGYGTSNNLTPSPLVEKSAVASVMPLFYMVKKIVSYETNDESSVGTQMSLMGYGEGGYSSIAAATAFRRQGIVPSVFAGAAPSKTIAKISPLKIFDEEDDIYLYELLFPYLLGLPMTQNQDIIPNARSDLPNDLSDFLVPVGVDFFGLFTNTSYPSGYLDPHGWYNALLATFDSEITNEGLKAMDILLQGDGVSLQMLRLYDKFKADNNKDPCLDASASFDQLCKVLEENDLSSSVESADFPIRLCHSMEDELVSYHNLPNQFANPQFVSMTETFGSHDQANLFCTLEFLNVFSVTSRQ